VPSVENGDWTVAADGTMEVTWKLRRGVLWHDGTPLHAEDFVLGYRVGVDPELFGRGTLVLRQMAEVVAQDAETLAIRWKNVYISANAIDLATLVPLPRHRFAALYDAGDKQAFANSRAWFAEWTGVGPYRISEWVPGSHISAEANDSYFLGRPRIGGLNIRFFGDMNTLITALMSADVDIVPVGSFKEEEASVLKGQWADSGAGSVIVSGNRLRYGAWQLRDPSAPWAKDPRVRQAMLHLIDRENIVTTIMNGLSSVDDIMLSREDPAYRLAQSQGLPKSNFDAREAHRLFGEAGLPRASDGTYRTQDGGPFALEVSVVGDINTNVQNMLAVSDSWKQAGVEPTTVVIPGTSNQTEVRAKIRGIHFHSGDLNYNSFKLFLTSTIDSEANRWNAGNVGGFSNPAYDALYPGLESTLRSSDRDPIAAQLIKLLLDNQAYLPLSYSSDVAAVGNNIRGVTGVLPLQRVTGWNVHQWDWARP
jgi:peptide/nickel transport system substrate-binding protein